MSELWFWAVAIPCGAIANFFAFQIFTRLESAGYRRRWWRMEDFRLYKLYWKLAPEHGWSRTPLIAICICFAIAAGVVLLFAVGSW